MVLCTIFSKVPPEHPTCLVSRLPETWLLTVRFGGIGNKEANHGHGTQRHHAADAEKEAHQGVIHAGRIPSQPGVVPGGCNGQRVHADRHPDICHCQVDRQQLRGLQEGGALRCCSEDG